MNKPTDKPTDDLVEALAKIEHDQWLYWSQAVSAHVPETVRSKWQSSWVDYNKLTDEVKEADRVWARKVISLLHERRLI